MGKSLILTLLLLNISTATLHNVSLVSNNEVVNIGTIKSGEHKRAELSSRDSVRVIFTLSQERQDWLATDRMAVDDIIISDTTTTYNVILIEENLENKNK